VSDEQILTYSLIENYLNHFDNVSFTFHDCIGGVMVMALVSGAVDHGFDHWCVNLDYKICMCSIQE
jgi:hypothetical protein